MSRDQIKEAILAELREMENRYEEDVLFREDLFANGIMSGMQRAIDIIIDMPESKHTVKELNNVSS